MIRDIDETSRAVLTGSTNFTETRIHKNLNHIVIFHSKRIANVFQEEYDEIQLGTFGEKRIRYGPEPKVY